MVKILITTIQMNLVPLGLGTKFTCIVVIKIFTINLPSQPFLGHHLGFHIFFHHSLFEGRNLFLQLGCFGLDFTSFCICIPQSQPLLTYHFLYQRKKKKMKKILNTLTNSNFISKCKNIYIYNTYIIYYYQWITCLQLISLLGDFFLVDLSFFFSRPLYRVTCLHSI